MPLPALLTIQSGINQLRYATLKGIMAAKKKEIKKVAPRGGRAVAAEDAGALRAAEGEADRHDRRLAGRSRQGAGQAAARRGARPMILVVAEQKDGKLNRASWEAIAAAQQLVAGRWRRGPVSVVVAGRTSAGWRRELAAADVSGVLTLGCTRRWARYTPDAFVQAMRQVIDAAEPQYVVFPHTYQTRDFAPALAATHRSRPHHRCHRRQGRSAARRRLRGRCFRAS